MRTLLPSNPLLRICALTLAAAALSACVTPHREIGDTGALTPTEMWRDKVSINTYPDEVLLAVRQGGLSPAQASALQAFVQRWMLAEGGAIRVRSPAPRDMPLQADGMAFAARDFLVAQGAPAWRIEMATYDSAGAKEAPLVVSFDLHQVEVPLCGADIENLTRTMMNEQPRNFGCAVTANLAAQIADPGDLLAPRGSDPADAGRRSTVLGKYRRGELTASPREEQASGSVSKAIQ